MKTFYMLRCPECEMTLAFGDRYKRDEWASAHSQVKDPFTDVLHSPVHTWEEAR